MLNRTSSAHRRTFQFNIMFVSPGRVTVLLICSVFITVQSQKNSEYSLNVDRLSCYRNDFSGKVIWSVKDDPRNLFGFHSDCKDCEPSSFKDWETHVANDTWPDFKLPFQSKKNLIDFSLKRPGTLTFNAMVKTGFGIIHLPSKTEIINISNYCFNITLDSLNATLSRISSCPVKTSNIRNPSNEIAFNLTQKEWTQYTIEWNSPTNKYNDDFTNIYAFINGTYLNVTDRRSYKYLRTETNGTSLIWSNIHPKGPRFYVNLVISIPKNCWVEFYLENKEHVTLAQDKFPIEASNSDDWQFIKLHIKSPQKSTQSGPYRLKMLTMTEQNLTSNTFIWRVSPYIRKCEAAGPDKCLKDLGQVCDFGCKSSCSGMMTCNHNIRDCTCVRGFEGPDCTKACGEGFYGADCTELCEKKCGNHTCDEVTGSCDEGKCRKFFVPPTCKTKLEKPVVTCVKESNLQFNSYNTQAKELRFEIKKKDGKWMRINVTVNYTPYKWNWDSIRDIRPNTSYNIRAQLNGTVGPEAEFNTSCWQRSKPQILSIEQLNNTVVRLWWTRRTYFWEKNLGLNVEILPLHLNLGTNKVNTTGTQKSTHGTLADLKRVSVDLNLQNTSINNRFLIKAIDAPSYGILNYEIEAWYLLPGEVGSAVVKEEQLNSSMKIMEVDFSKIGSNTTQSTIYVVMRNSSTCPVFKKNQKSGDNELKKIFSKDKIKKLIVYPPGEYPACQLLLNQTYAFLVTVEDPGTWILKWLLSLVVFLVFVGMLSVSYWTYKRRLLSLGLTLMDTVSEEEMSVVSLNQCQSEEEQNLKKFEDYVQRAAENGVLERQFKKLPRGLVRPCECGKLPRNKPKNRYGNLIAYDDTRVRLSKSLPDKWSDYINANYIQGYNKDKAYIATQGPLQNTIADFWKMIWQEEVQIICMLVDLFEDEEKVCELYWPEETHEMRYGDVVVTTLTRNVLADYTYRTFSLRKGDRQRPEPVTHLQFTGWPKQGIPMHSHSVVEYLKKLLSLPPGQGPIVVHCTGGTGRTGTIILCDITLRRLVAEGNVDVFAEAQKMYHARANMLNNMEQYVLAHLVPSQYLFMQPTKLLCSELNEKKIAEMKEALPRHMARLEETSWMDNAFQPLGPLRPPHPENILKNRFPKLTPVGSSLVTLSKYPTYDPNSSYISAVSVDGAKIKQQYLASQLPMPSTRTDFWRLIVEKNIELIIILQQPDPDDETCCDIVPRGTTLIPLPHLKVITKTRAKPDKYFTTDKLLLTDTSVSPESNRNITALTCNNWTAEEEAEPPEPIALVELWRASEKIQRSDGRTLVLCYNGLTGCGLYLALSFMLDRMGAEQECDVILAVKAIRRSRQQFCNSQSQFEYLYDAAVEYSKIFGNYANFTHRRKIELAVHG